MKNRDKSRSAVAKFQTQIRKLERRIDQNRAHRHGDACDTWQERQRIASLRAKLK